MSTEDLFTHSAKASTEPAQKMHSNVPEMSVSELANSLKRTLEETYGRIRIRGELQGLKLAGSGHLYGDIKDENANINIICWRGTMSKLSMKPEEGMDVIVTGKVSSYPKSSRYQIIIDSMEIAGEGALLKMLEDRRKKLAAEGLFDAARKKRLPFLPQTIGVITSPTGAVIQDIMHRLKDRFPRHVLLWPVSVQGEGAAQQIARAIEGFNNFDGLSLPRPDLLIVARGGGSLEDLMAFNEEIVVRAAANSVIPIISAVGHETDTTLIDYACDLRAPTPTGAAEMAVPRRIDLMAQINEDQNRLIGAVGRIINNRQNILETQIAKLGKPSQILDTKVQAIDHLGDKLNNALRQNVAVKDNQAARLFGRLKSPSDRIKSAAQLVQYQSERLIKTAPRLLKDKQTSMDGLNRMLESLSFKSVLKRGYSVVMDENKAIIKASKDVHMGQNLTILFDKDDNLAVKVQEIAKN
ncbi:MAG: exodeoxyribonuclease VII large subunit [Alphaproteobacteria bacterium]|nr:exodeoxyribonuclease VII large subunit [Alphaproteobacteria bacterium]NCQ88626.1 exodeoxyribonuclease VII large subunit [Alphaproteobacteria bacterium]NCT06169.1 exodeoxyribonuclease VII large subunit [Alphaproteobacteria bacterium]